MIIRLANENFGNGGAGARWGITQSGYCGASSKLFITNAANSQDYMVAAGLSRGNGFYFSIDNGGCVDGCPEPASGLYNAELYGWEMKGPEEGFERIVQWNKTEYKSWTEWTQGKATYFPIKTGASGYGYVICGQKIDTPKSGKTVGAVTMLGVGGAARSLSMRLDAYPLSMKDRSHMVPGLAGGPVFQNNGRVKDVSTTILKDDGTFKYPEVDWFTKEGQVTRFGYHYSVSPAECWTSYEPTDPWVPSVKATLTLASFGTTFTRTTKMENQLEPRWPGAWVLKGGRSQTVLNPIASPGQIRNQRGQALTSVSGSGANFVKYPYWTLAFGWRGQAGTCSGETFVTATQSEFVADPTLKIGGTYSRKWTGVSGGLEIFTWEIPGTRDRYEQPCYVASGKTYTSVTVPKAAQLKPELVATDGANEATIYFHSFGKPFSSTRTKKAGRRIISTTETYFSSLSAGTFVEIINRTQRRTSYGTFAWFPTPNGNTTKLTTAKLSYLAASSSVKQVTENATAPLGGEAFAYGPSVRGMHIKEQFGRQEYGEAAGFMMLPPLGPNRSCSFFLKDDRTSNSKFNGADLRAEIVISRKNNFQENFGLPFKGIKIFNFSKEPYYNKLATYGVSDAFVGMRAAVLGYANGSGEGNVNNYMLPGFWGGGNLVRPLFGVPVLGGASNEPNARESYDARRFSALAASKNFIPKSVEWETFQQRVPGFRDRVFTESLSPGKSPGKSGGIPIP